MLAAMSASSLHSVSRTKYLLMIVLKNVMISAIYYKETNCDNEVNSTYIRLDGNLGQHQVSDCTENVSIEIKLHGGLFNVVFKGFSFA